MRIDLTTTEDAAALARMEQQLLTKRAGRAAQQARAEDAERRMAIGRMEQGLWAARRRRAELAWREYMDQRFPASRPQATAGRGWKVLEHPRASHESLEAHAREIWGFVWHGIDWPAGWRVRWGETNTKELMSIGDWIRELGRVFKHAQCALSVDDRVLGLCVVSQKIILIDEGTHRALHRTPRQCKETLIHELIHAHVHDDGDHGPRFAAALKSATDYYFGPADAPAPAPLERGQMSSVIDISFSTSPPVASGPAQPEPAPPARARAKEATQMDTTEATNGHD